MRMVYSKLVRDRVPEVIHRDGHTCETVIMKEEEYRKALREKLLEEAQEAASACGHELVTELADLHEVIAALMRSYGIAPERVQAEQERRRIERGGFERRIRLVWIE